MGGRRDGGARAVSVPLRRKVDRSSPGALQGSAEPPRLDGMPVSPATAATTSPWPCSQRLAEAGITPSAGAVGSSNDPLAESIKCRRRHLIASAYPLNPTSMREEGVRFMFESPEHASGRREAYRVGRCTSGQANGCYVLVTTLKRRFRRSRAYLVEFAGESCLLPDKVDYDFIIDNDDELESFVAELRVTWIEEAADEAHALRTVFSDRLPEVP